MNGKFLKRVCNIVRKKGNAPKMKLEDDYTIFIKSGLNINFTDEQVDWLWYWMNKLK